MNWTSLAIGSVALFAASGFGEAAKYALQGEAVKAGHLVFWASINTFAFVVLLVVAVGG